MRSRTVQVALAVELLALAAVGYYVAARLGGRTTCGPGGAGRWMPPLSVGAGLAVAGAVALLVPGRLRRRVNVGVPVGAVAGGAAWILYIGASISPCLA